MIKTLTSRIVIRIYVLLLSVLLLIHSPSAAQRKIGFTMPDGKKRVEIPFEEYSNLIVIEIVINGFLPLKFVLDTGAESIILTQKLYGDILNLNYVREIAIQGAGIVGSLEASVAANVGMSLPGGIHGDGLNMLVLKEDYLRLSETLGEEIYGIIGYDIFSRFVVTIDYDENTLTLHDPGNYKPKRRLHKVPIEINHTKPYLKSVVQQGTRRDSVRLMVDAGASHSLLLDVRNTDDIVLPEKLLSTRLGQGLGGEIPGFLGRLSAYHLDKYSFEDILVSIPIAGAYTDAIKRGSRHGTIGGDVLCRFQVTFDYFEGALYLQKGKEFSEPFEFDMSGMAISAYGEHLDSMRIERVRKNTPAYYVGLRPGDVVLHINGMDLSNSKFSEITSLLKERDGLKIKMRIQRDQKKITKVFFLRRMI